MKSLNGAFSLKKQVVSKSEAPMPPQLSTIVDDEDEDFFYKKQ
jgi:hypothetical protein